MISQNKVKYVSFLLYWHRKMSKYIYTKVHISTTLPQWSKINYCILSWWGISSLGGVFWLKIRSTISRIIAYVQKVLETEMEKTRKKMYLCREMCKRGMDGGVSFFWFDKALDSSRYVYKGISFYRCSYGRCTIFRLHSVCVSSSYD